MTEAVTTSLGAISGQKAERLGLPFVLILIYLLMEYARPANPMMIPLIISVLLFLQWIPLPEKNWSPQIICFFLLLAVIAIMGPFATNSYAIFWGFRDMVFQLLFVCIPIAHFVNSPRKLATFTHALIALYVYVVILLILHGSGPGGHIDDVNDVALALNMMIPFAFVSIFLANSRVQRVFFMGVFGLMVSGVIATFSRGGFVGLIPVLLYCFVLLPKKRLAVVMAMFLTLGVWMFTPDSYWSEMGTIEEEVRIEYPGGGRREYWRVAWNMFSQNPIFGVGFGNFTYNINQYQTETQFVRLERSMAGQAVHSVYFGILAELGIAGVLIFGTILWYNLKDTQRIVKTVRGWQGKGRSVRSGRGNGADMALWHDLNTAMFYSHAIRASLVGFLVSGIFLSAFHYPHFWNLTAFTVALKAVFDRRLRTPAEAYR